MPPSFVDLFCGAGGWTTGLKRAGLKHVVGIDIDAKAVASYNANHGDGAAVVMDIATMSENEARPYAADVVFASPPCQSFSMSGPRTVGSGADALSSHAVRVAKMMGARLVVIENVIGMLSKRDSEGRLVMDNLVDNLERAGYAHIRRAVLKAEEHGVPQLRRRVVIFAGVDAVPPFPEPAAYDASALAIGNMLEPREFIAHEFWMAPAKRQYYLDRHARSKGQYVKFVRRDQIARTVRAGYGKSRGAEALLLYDDDAMRMLTEVELARIQSFPEGYVFTGGHIAAYTQIGNAVPPALAKSIGECVVRFYDT